MPLVYQELHRTAHRYMARERTGHTLQTTALINEVYVRLVDFQGMSWQNRNHFFAICANLMRRVLTDFARSRRFLKRGGDAIHFAFDETLFGGRERAAGIVALDDALNALAVIDERKSRRRGIAFLRWAECGRDSAGAGCLGRDCDAGLETCEGVALPRVD